METESLLILPYLQEINIHGYISFESQPHIVKQNFHSMICIQRAFINGIYPRHKIPSLCASLPDGIVFSETIFNDNKVDELIFHGRKDFDTPLLYDGLYPIYLLIMRK